MDLFHIHRYDFVTFGTPEIGDTRYNVIIPDGAAAFFPKFTVTFNFTCDFITQLRLLPQGSHDEIDVSPECSIQPNIQTSAKITKDQLSDRQEALTTLHNQLNHWPLVARLRQEVIEFALEKAYKSAQLIPRYCDAIEINCPVTVVWRVLYMERSVIELMLERSIMEEAEKGIIPAMDTSIESLKIVVMLVDSGETCSVCLEEMKEGCEAMEMPCSHLFHGDCIKKWLRTSHVCPLCRFQMPTY